MAWVFWLSAALMTAAALGFILWPLMRRPAGDGPSRSEFNIAIYRERRAAIEKALDAGELDQAAAEELKADLDHRLLGDVDPDADDPPSEAARGDRRLILAVALLLPLLAGLVYFSGDSWRLAAQPGPDTELQFLVQRLENTVAAEPQNLEALKTLAQGYQIQERYAKAADTLQRINRITASPQPEYLLDEAEMRALAAEGSLQGKPEQLIQQALAIDPSHQRALWFAGMAGVQRNDAETAREYWDRLADQDLPQDFADILDKQLAALGGEPEATSAPDVQLRFNLQMAPELRTEAEDDAVLYVFAKAVGGPPAPLAVKRLRVGNLPAAVTLSDADTMLPGVSLGDHETLEVTARISATGEPAPNSGDPYGQIQIDRSQATDTYDLTIDRRWP